MKTKNQKPPPITKREHQAAITFGWAMREGPALIQRCIANRCGVLGVDRPMTDANIATAARRMRKSWRMAA